MGISYSSERAIREAQQNVDHVRSHVRHVEGGLMQTISDVNGLKVTAENAIKQLGTLEGRVDGAVVQLAQLQAAAASREELLKARMQHSVERLELLIYAGSAFMALLLLMACIIMYLLMRSRQRKLKLKMLKQLKA